MMIFLIIILLIMFLSTFFFRDLIQKNVACSIFLLIDKKKGWTYVTLDEDCNDVEEEHESVGDVSVARVS